MKKIIAITTALMMLAAGTAALAHGAKGMHRNSAANTAQTQTCPNYGYCQNNENCPNGGVRKYDGSGNANGRGKACHGGGVCVY